MGSGVSSKHVSWRLWQFPGLAQGASYTMLWLTHPTFKYAHTFRLSTVAILSEHLDDLLRLAPPIVCSPLTAGYSGVRVKPPRSMGRWQWV